MKEAKQLLDKYTALEAEMQRFCGLATQVMDCIGKQEFVPEKVNTEMMQCIIELNQKEKDCFSLYSKIREGERPPVQLEEMKNQIQRQIEIEIENERKEKYLAAVKTSFHSLYTEDAEVSRILDEFKKKMDVIRTDKYTLEQCLVYIRPFAVFLDMLREDNPVKSFEQVPVLVDYFGSELVAHITVVKDIHIGSGAVPFNLDDVNGSSAGGNAEMANTPSVDAADDKQNTTAEDNVIVLEEVVKASAQNEKEKSESVEIIEPVVEDVKEEALTDNDEGDEGGIKTEDVSDDFVSEPQKEEGTEQGGIIEESISRTEDISEAVTKSDDLFPIEEEDVLIEVAEPLNASDVLTKIEESQFKDMPVMEEEIPLDLDEVPVRVPKRDPEKVKRAVEKTAAAYADSAEERIERLERLEEEKRQREEGQNYSLDEEVSPLEKWNMYEEKELTEEERKKDNLKVLLSDEGNLESKLYDPELEQMERKKNAPKTFWGKYKEG